jgi:hypothetical protein
MQCVPPPIRRLSLGQFSQAMCPAKISKTLIAKLHDRGESPQQTWRFATAGWLQRVNLDESYWAMALARQWLWARDSEGRAKSKLCTIAGPQSPGSRCLCSDVRLARSGRYPAFVFANRPRLYCPLEDWHRPDVGHAGMLPQITDRDDIPSKCND